VSGPLSEGIEASARRHRAGQSREVRVSRRDMHEMGTPVNGAIGMIDVLHHSSLKGDQIEMVDVIRESADALLAIIVDILGDFRINVAVSRSSAHCCR
jgi:signal transduction histidine kinase